jgi:hypothetical protein
MDALATLTTFQGIRVVDDDVRARRRSARHLADRDHPLLVSEPQAVTATSPSTLMPD